MYTVCLTIDMFKYICTYARVLCFSFEPGKSICRKTFNKSSDTQWHWSTYQSMKYKLNESEIYYCLPYFTTKRMKLLWLKQCCKTEISTSVTCACFSYLFPYHKRWRNKNYIVMDIYFNHVSTNHILIYNAELQHADKLQPRWNSCNFSSKTNLKLWNTRISYKKELIWYPP